MVSPNPKEIALAWLTNYATALYSASASNVAQLFLPDGWLRDVLTFTWDMRSLEGRTKIEAYLTEENALKQAGISSVQLDERQFLQPQQFHLPRGQEGIEGSFTFETRVGHGRGLVKLLRDVDGEWRAYSVSMLLSDLRGHEEASYESGLYGGHTIAWEEVFAERKHRIETNPHVLISMYWRFQTLRCTDSFRSRRRPMWSQRGRSFQANGDPLPVNREEYQNRRQLEEEISHFDAPYYQNSPPK